MKDGFESSFPIDIVYPLYLCCWGYLHTLHSVTEIWFMVCCHTFLSNFPLNVVILVSQMCSSGSVYTMNLSRCKTKNGNWNWFCGKVMEKVLVLQTEWKCIGFFHCILNSTKIEAIFFPCLQTILQFSQVAHTCHWQMSAFWHMSSSYHFLFIVICKLYFYTTIILAKFIINLGK